jgi:ABC-type transport system involved in cytochrome c biogenesis permease subunit
MTSEEILLRDAFLLGIELKVFWLVALLYGVCFLTGVFYVLSARQSLGRALTAGLWLTVLIHTLLIVFRTVEGGRPPFQTLYETLSWFSWSAVITYLIVHNKWKEVHFPGVIVSGIAMGACLYSLLTRSPEIIPIPPALQSPWYEWHVIVAFLAYAVFVVSFSVEVTHILLERWFRFRAPAFGLPMEGFHRYTHRLVLFGFPLLAFAIFSGAAWANDAWGRYWSWDPKETWSLITWTVYAMYLHTKAIPRWQGKVASFLNILGFICMIMTFLGVNWLAKLLGIPSIHAYAV